MNEITIHTYISDSNRPFTLKVVLDIEFNWNDFIVREHKDGIH